MPLKRTTLPRKTSLKRERILGTTTKKGRLKKAKTVSQLMKEADKVFSRWLRQRNLDENGLQTCYTCGYKALPQKLQAGHFVSRFYKTVRYDESNVRPQCVMCNMWKKGDYVTFRENLVKEVGLKEVERVEAERKQPFKSSAYFFERIILKYG
jgi:hypothetical protein